MVAQKGGAGVRYVDPVTDAPVVETNSIRFADDPVEAIEQMIARGEDAWEAIVSAGMQDENDMTSRRWRQGDLAALVEKEYGEDRIGAYAKAINAPVSTVKQRREMSAFYKKDTRYLFEDVGYTHYRDAKRLGDIDKALWALEKASTRGWTAERFGMILTRYLKGKGQHSPQKLVDIEVPIDRIAGIRVTFQLAPKYIDKLMDQWTANRTVRLVIHETPTPEEEQG